MNEPRESEVCRDLSHKFGVVQAHRTSSNRLKMKAIREREVRRVFSQKFGVVQAHRTSSNNTTEIARCGESCHMSSGWFDCTEPSLSTSLQGKQGVQGA